MNILKRLWYLIGMISLTLLCILIAVPVILVWLFTGKDIIEDKFNHVAHRLEDFVK